MMRLYLIAIVVGLAPVAALAKPVSQANCDLVEALAVKIMEGRQKGIPMSEMMNIEGTSKMLKRITIDAYSQPQFRTEQNKINAINEFGNKWALLCYRGEVESG